MPQIHISVRDKVARAARRTPSIVCGNADYEIVFDFDSEWDAHDQKVARFIWGDAYYDVPFMGNACSVPTVVDASEVELGVYAGDLRTTTPATIACRRSIRSGPSLPIHDEALAEYEHRAVEAAATAQSAAGEAQKAYVQAQETCAQVQETVTKTQTMKALAEEAAATARRAGSDAQQAKTGAEQSAENAAQTAKRVESMIEQINTDTESARAHAAQMNEHASVTHTRHIFTVGADSELAYMTENSTGVYTASGAYRYNDEQRTTVYRYPLVDSAHITSALWHAHLAQQVLLQASADGVEWVTLRDNGNQQLGTQYHYELCDVLDLSNAEALYIKIGDSNAEDGFGGAILADIPVTLDITHGQSAPFALPTVSKQDDGAFLRVIGGKWRKADATALVSRVRTYSFKVGESSEEKYRLSNSTGTTNTTCRFNDGSRFTTYRYHIANAALVRRVTWTATVGQQLLLECSTDGENWKTVFDAEKTQLPFSRTTFDLTDMLNLLAFDEVYVRISDSDPSDGFGGAIQMSGSVDLHVERCEPPVYM